jgi:LPS O-antigen subunit length determinant protein (WzzB/FepE family)
MARFRSHGWKPEELKIYWNAKQLENLSPKHETNDKQIQEKEKTKLEADDDSKDEAKNNQIKEETETKVEESDEVKNKELAAPVETKDEDADEVKTKQIVAEAENLLPHDPSDADVILSLSQYPVSKRNHAGKITYVNKGIEKAVFDAPEDAQLIVLNFAVSHSLDIFLDYISTF